MPSDNPYTPPTAQVADAPETKKGAPIKAVLVALLVDIGGSVLFTLIFAAAYGASLGASGLSKEEIAAAASRIEPDSWVFIASTGVGLFFSLFAGYLCARIARNSEYRSGLSFAVLTTLAGWMMGGEQSGFAMHVMLSIVSFALVLFGVKLGRDRNLQT